MNDFLSAGLLGSMPGLAQQQGGLLSQQQPQPQQSGNFAQMAGPYAGFAGQQQPQQQDYNQMASPYAQWAAQQLQKVTPQQVQQPPDQQALFNQMMAQYQGQSFNPAVPGNN